MQWRIIDDIHNIYLIYSLHISLYIVPLILSDNNMAPYYLYPYSIYLYNILHLHYIYNLAESIDIDNTSHLDLPNLMDILLKIF